MLFEAHAKRLTGSLHMDTPVWLTPTGWLNCNLLPENRSSQQETLQLTVKGKGHELMSNMDGRAPAISALVA